MGRKKKQEEKNFDIKRNLSIYRRFLKPYRWLFALTLFFVAIEQLAVIADKFLLKGLIDKATGVSQGLLGQDALLASIVIVGALFFGIVVSRSVSHWLFIHFLNLLESRIIVDVKRHFFHHILTLSHRFHATNRTGSLISRLTRGGGAIERLTDATFFNFAPLLFRSLAVILSLLYFDTASALIVIATILLFVTYSVTLQQLSRPSNVKANEAEDFEKGTVADFFMNVESIKFFGKERVVNKKYVDVSEKARLAALENWHYYRWTSAGQIFIIGLGTIALLFTSLFSFIAGTMTIGTLIFVYTSYANLVEPLYSFVRGVREFYRSMADIDPLFNYASVEQEVKDKPEAKPLVVTKGAVAYEGVTFCYDKRLIFKGYSLKVPPHKKVALVGHSGCGKTTLVKLLYRFYDVQKGRILVDGTDVRDVQQESLRSSMSVVPQECILFDDTIYNNIAFSKPDASRKEVLAAIKAARLDRIIATFPAKENTIVGERGIKLSGGEKQRVSIARALLADRKILVLDEATSSLDSRTEHEIQVALAKLMEGRTTIIIAHRLSTIMSADLIVVMSKGRIVQTGTHEELLRQGGEYKKLWDLQKGGYISE